MKKILSLALVVVMVLGLSAISFAATTTGEAPDYVPYEAEYVGTSESHWINDYDYQDVFDLKLFKKGNDILLEISKDNEKIADAEFNNGGEWDNRDGLLYLAQYNYDTGEYDYNGDMYINGNPASSGSGVGFYFYKDGTVEISLKDIVELNGDNSTYLHALQAKGLTIVEKPTEPTQIIQPFATTGESLAKLYDVSIAGLSDCKLAEGVTELTKEEIAEQTVAIILYNKETGEKEVKREHSIISLKYTVEKGKIVNIYIQGAARTTNGVRDNYEFTFVV